MTKKRRGRMTKQTTVKKTVPWSEWKRAIAEAKKAGVTTHLWRTSGQVTEHVVVTEAGMVLVW